MKCPKCGFEQLDASAHECAKCGILFEKYLARERERLEVERERLEVVESAPDPARFAPSGAQDVQIALHPSPGSAAPGLGTLFLQIGTLLCVLPILSFGLNFVGFEFILLLPLEAFENPSSAKLWMIGGGVLLGVLGGSLGGGLPSDD